VSNRRVHRFHQEEYGIVFLSIYLEKILFCIAQVHEQGSWSAELTERRSLVLELELHLRLVFLHWRTICKQKVQ
jgi:hypothetical protein